MARVEVTEDALDDLARLIATHQLPGDTRARVRGVLGRLERFPESGTPLTERWEGLRFMVGPWRWMLVVYIYDETFDRVSIVTVQDARSSRAATSTR